MIAFARIREILGSAASERTLDSGATVASAWEALAGEFPALQSLRASTRFARNGTFVSESQTLGEGDELALLPPYGGG